MTEMWMEDFNCFLLKRSTTAVLKGKKVTTVKPTVLQLAL